MQGTTHSLSSGSALEAEEVEAGEGCIGLDVVKRGSADSAIGETGVQSVHSLIQTFHSPKLGKTPGRVATRSLGSD